MKSFRVSNRHQPHSLIQHQPKHRAPILKKFVFILKLELRKCLAELDGENCPSGIFFKGTYANRLSFVYIYFFFPPEIRLRVM